MENTVQITSAEYENMLKTKFDLEVVKDVLLNMASLDWTGKYLVWRDESTSTILRYIMGDASDKKLEELNSKEDDE